MSEEKTFELQDLISKLKKDGNYFLDFLDVRQLQAGIIVLRPWEKDAQVPHSADELYFVVDGNGYIELGKSKRPVKKGTIIFVPAKMRHRFYGNKEDLVVLYIFAE